MDFRQQLACIVSEAENSRRMTKRKVFCLGEAVSVVSRREEENDDEFEEYENLEDVIEAEAELDESVEMILLPPNRVDSISDEEVVDEDDLLPSAMQPEVPGSVAVHLPERHTKHKPIMHEKKKGMSENPKD